MTYNVFSGTLDPARATTLCHIYGSIATIFGTNIAEKVGNQNVLHFPTSPN